MREITSQADAARAGRYLMAGPPRYSIVRSRLDELLAGLGIYHLWRDVFGEDVSGNDNLWSLRRRFVDRVQSEFFPLDNWTMNQLLLSDEHALENPIPLRGWRVPWEAAHTEELSAYQQVVASCITAARLGLGDEFGWMDMGCREINPDDPEWSPWSILDARPATPDVPDVPWMYEDTPRGYIEGALRRLAAFPYPVSGLADLIRVSLDLNDANPFLDLPSGLWAAEYDTCGWGWDAASVRTLAIHYDEARPTIGRIEAFRRWFYYAFEHERDAHGAVLRMLEVTW